jgi:glycosyltransferase involved in cell wall biosynthesis
MTPAGAAPLVSVIVPCYNAAKTLRSCLLAAVGQTYRPVEVVVVDDASTDDSAGIAELLGVRVHRRTVNGGVSAARNLGVARSSGAVLFFLDSDVELAPDAVANAVAVLRSDPDCGCVYGVLAEQPLYDDGPVEWYRTLHLHSVLIRAVGVVSTAVFAMAAMPRAVFDRIGPFDENLRSAEDDEYSDRLLPRYRIRLTGTVAGRHDEADRLIPLLREQFRRAQLMRFAVRGRLRPGALKVNRMTGVSAAGLIAVSLPAAVWWPALLPVPALLIVLFALADPPLTRLVLRERGPLFLVFFIAVHLLVHLAMIAGAAAGLLRSAADPQFGPSSRSTERLVRDE